MPNVAMPICAWEKRSQPFTHAASMDRMGTPSEVVGGAEEGGRKGDSGRKSEDASTAPAK
jgi:hypothetical protein